MEATCHARTSFVTLTYDNAYYPEFGDLCPDHLQRWLKRIRKFEVKRSGGKLRYFAVGEYGDRLGRPHYHVALFGLGCEQGGGIRGCACSSCEGVRKTWGLGHVLIGSWGPQSASYVCGYVSRKATSDYWGDRVPPFRRMSLVPGLGAVAVRKHALDVLQLRLGELRGVPTHLLLDGKSLLLGRQLRLEYSRVTGEKLTKVDVGEKLSVVRAFAWENGRSVASVFRELGESYASVLAQKEELVKSRKAGL